MNQRQARDGRMGCRKIRRSGVLGKMSGLVRLAVLGGLCLWAVGCTHNSYWYQRGHTLSEAERDCQECYRKAQVLASEASWDQRLDTVAAPGEPDGGQWSYAYLDSEFRRCMKNAGYSLILETDLDKSVKKRTLHLSAVQSIPIAGD